MSFVTRGETRFEHERKRVTRVMTGERGKMR